VAATTGLRPTVAAASFNRNVGKPIQSITTTDARSPQAFPIWPAPAKALRRALTDSARKPGPLYPSRVRIWSDW